MWRSSWHPLYARLALVSHGTERIQEDSSAAEAEPPQRPELMEEVAESEPTEDAEPAAE